MKLALTSVTLLAWGVASAALPLPKADKPTMDACSKMPEGIKWMTRPTALEGAETYIYRGSEEAGVDLRLHVFRPANCAKTIKLPAIALIFGGGWVWGTVEEFALLARELAQKGMVVVLVDTRVKCRDESTPFDSVSDTQAAMRYLRKYADTLGIDKDRIAAGGHSSGAHLALSLAFVPDTHLDYSSIPNALVLISPPLDFTKPDKLTIERFGHEVTDRMMRELSPMQHFNAAMTVPTLILNGDHDKSTPASVAKKYCDLVGDSCTLVTLHGGTHENFATPAGWPLKNSPESPLYREVVTRIEEFLTQIRYLPLIK